MQLDWKTKPDGTEVVRFSGRYPRLTDDELDEIAREKGCSAWKREPVPERPSDCVVIMFREEGL